MPPATFDVVEVNGQLRLIRTPASARQRDLIKRMRALSLEPAPVTKPAASSPPSTQKIGPLNSPSKRQADFEHFKNDECPSKRRSPRPAVDEIARNRVQKSQPTGPFFRLLDLPAEIRNIIWKFANPKTPKCCCEGLWWHKVGDLPKHAAEYPRYDCKPADRDEDVVFAYGQLGRGIPVNRQILRESRRVATPSGFDVCSLDCFFWMFHAMQDNYSQEKRQVEYYLRGCVPRVTVSTAVLTLENGWPYGRDIEHLRREFGDLTWLRGKFGDLAWIRGARVVSIEDDKLVTQASIHSLLYIWQSKIQHWHLTVTICEIELENMRKAVVSRNVERIRRTIALSRMYETLDEPHDEAQSDLEQAQDYIARKAAESEGARRKLHLARYQAFKYGSADFEWFQHVNEQLKPKSDEPDYQPTSSKLKPKTRG
jgi:hypothetical protein